MLFFREWSRKIDHDLNVFGEPFWTDDLGKPDANPVVQTVARDYCASVGLPAPNHSVWVDCDQIEHGEIADAYDALPELDTRPAVQEAYAALVQECIQQFRFAQSRGMTFTRSGAWRWRRTPTSVEPYDGNAFEVMDDIRNNRHLFYFTGGEPNVYMRAVDPVSGMVVNDIFRVIHDYFGHGAVGADFGPRGEENAWVSHVQMFSPLARRALSVETRGQNSWVNFGQQNYDGEGNYLNIPPSARPFAKQKTAIFDGENEWVNDLPLDVVLDESTEYLTEEARPSAANVWKSVRDACFIMDKNPGDFHYRVEKFPVKKMKPRETGKRYPTDALAIAYENDPANLPPPCIYEDGYILNGHHRWRAAKAAGLTEMWCVIVGDITNAERDTPCQTPGCGHAKHYHNGSMWYGWEDCVEPGCTCKHFTGLHPDAYPK